MSNKILDLQLLLETLEKSKAYPDGTHRTWGGIEYIKTAGKWLPFKQGKQGAVQPEATDKPIQPVESPKLEIKPQVTDPDFVDKFTELEDIAKEGKRKKR